MAGETTKTIAEIFETMEYGTVNEPDSSAKVYFKNHENEFSAFISDRVEKNCQCRVFNPCNREELGTVWTCSGEVVPEIVKEMQDSPWSKLSGSERGKHMRRIAKEIESKHRLLAEVESVSTGRLFRTVSNVDVPALVHSFNQAANANELRDQSMWEPVGVVLVTAERTNPFFTYSWQLTDILAVGNCIVMVISPENLFISCLLIAEMCKAAGLLNGVLNVLPAVNINVNTWIKSLPPSQKILQYFPTELLREPSALSLTVIPNRNPTVIVFDAVDLHSAADGTIVTLCSSVCGVRLLVQESVYNKFLPILKEKFLKLKVSSSMDKIADLAPIFTTESLLQNWKAMLIESEKKGAKIIKLESNGLVSCRHFPILVENIQTSSPIVQKQALPGPAILVLPFRTAKEATALANSWAPGGEVMLWTERSAIALEVASLLKAGCIWINGANIASDTRYLRQGGFSSGSWYDYVNLRTECSEAPKAVGVRCPSRFTLKELEYDKLYYGGKCQKSTQSKTFKLLTNSAPKMATFISVAEAVEKDVASAAAAARSALPGWGGRSGRSRAKFLCSIAEKLERAKEEFVMLLNRDVNASATAEEEFERSVQVLYHWAALCQENRGEIKDEESGALMTVQREPVGVIGIICPCKDSLLAFVTLLAATISQGNCIVIVPSEDLPLPAIRMFQIFDIIALPEGVVNVLTGSINKQIYDKLLKQVDIQAVWNFNCQQILQVNPWKNYLYLEDFPWQGPFRETDPVLLAAVTQAKSVWSPIGDIFAN